MNIDRLTTIRAYLKTPPKGFKQGFNMSHWGHETDLFYPDLLGAPGECGTVHCIAGLANVFWGDDPKSHENLFHISADILELTDAQSSGLFYARECDTPLSDITVSMAVQAITSLIKTGTVTWIDEERTRK